MFFEIMASMEGIVTPLQRKLPSQILDHMDDLSKRVSTLDTMVKDYLTEYENAISANSPALDCTAQRSSLRKLVKIWIVSSARLIFLPGLVSVPEITKAQARKNAEGQQDLRTCIHNRLSKVWKWEITTIDSAEETEIS